MDFNIDAAHQAGYRPKKIDLFECPDKHEIAFKIAQKCLLGIPGMARCRCLICCEEEIIKILNEFITRP
jgi:hypothetical protein